MEPWRAFAERYQPTLYLFAESEGLEPWLAEYCTTTQGAKRLPNVIVAYGSSEAPRLRVGTWDAGWVSDRALTDEEEVFMARQNVGTRLVVAAASAGSVRREAIGELISSVAGAPWDSTTVSIDGVDLGGWTLSLGKHRISYATNRGRTVVVETADWSSRVDLVSSRDYDVLA